MADKPAPKNAKEIEAELQASRQRLASTIDELAFRAQPKEVAKRQVEGLKMVGGAGAFLLVLGLLRRLRG